MTTTANAPLPEQIAAAFACLRRPAARALDDRQVSEAAHAALEHLSEAERYLRKVLQL